MRKVPAVRKVNLLTFTIDDNGSVSYNSHKDFQQSVPNQSSTTSYVAMGKLGNNSLFRKVEQREQQSEEEVSSYLHGRIWTPNKRISIIHVKRLWNHLLIEPYVLKDVYQLIFSDDYQSFYLQLTKNNPLFPSNIIRKGTFGDFYVC